MSDSPTRIQKSKIEAVKAGSATRFWKTGAPLSIRLLSDKNDNDDECTAGIYDKRSAWAAIEMGSGKMRHRAWRV